MPIRIIGISVEAININILNSNTGIKNFNEREWVTLSKAAIGTPYSAEYLSLLARKRKLPAQKIKNVWHITKFALDEYVKKQIARAYIQNGGFGSTQTMESPSLEIAPVVAVSVQPKLKKTDTVVKLYLPLILSFVFIFSLFLFKAQLLSLKPVNDLYQTISVNANQIQSSNAFLSSILSWYRNIFGNESQKNVLLVDSSYFNNNIVIFPEAKDRLLASSNIKNVFSDEVNINFDIDSADTGVIVPVFRENDNFDNYAFVLVPVNSASTTQ